MTGPDVVLRGRVATPDTLLDDGAVVVRGDRIAWVGPVAHAAAAGFPAVAGEPRPAPGTTLLPGLVDLHNHGGGGAGFPDVATRDEAMVAVLEHRRHGTTTLLASLVSADRATLLERAELLAGLADDGEIAGIHAEGPFLSHARRGAHSPAALVPGDAGLVRELAAAARGHLRTMTVAPEVEGVAGPGGAAEALVEAGAIPSLGHTDGTTEQAEELVAEVVAGLRAAAGPSAPPREMTATHLFNGMRPLHHRQPGPIAACLAAAARGEMVVELIADDVHLALATVRSVVRTLGADRVALVTDAMAAAGMADGAYELGPMAVTVRDGVARATDPDHPEGGAIAGGTAHLVDVVRATVAAGITLVDAVRSASWVPARVLGLDDVGGLVAGRRADVVVTDRDLRVQRVLRAGAGV
ncbi:N-acetylglucosamine-6-phosphate deacetylase [Isoptericola variabilis]|uniref:N-acetylglucosamine-6-phosphate deacetylase n=1 Tax=Isoptericola variabilis (strain 225) TaxID=743718 RepID=F6FR65_ISOV2|nr:amidohydrolase family protein [Isoptericola variabilis]AEG45015.1 N-acetylglucosamine-6-phosphate deacetylase [Isoptericola variabilis 225]TWH26141.1 N-acetylglucosamine-6-phosphate deacetylase [Isoptericola variabilis J7]